MMNNKSSHLILIPGWGFKSSIFEKFKLNLAPIDIHEFNITPFNGTSYAPIDIAKKILNDLSNQGIKHADVIAWSYGGLIAAHLTHSSLINKTILIASTAKFSEDMNWSGISKKIQEEFFAAIPNKLSVFKKKFVRLVQYPNHSPELRSFLEKHMENDDQRLWSDTLSELFSNDCRSLYTDLRKPVLLIYGGKDAIIPENNYKEFILLNKNIKHVCIDDAGHIPFLTHEHVVLNEIKNFLGEF